jgi:hypothetical protein
LDHAQYDALTNEIESLTEHKSTLRDEANERAVRQRNDFHSKATSSQARAVQEFPDCAKKDSSLVKEMIALDAEWKEDGNPLYHSPDKPYLLAQRASARLQRLAPAAPAAPAASPQPVVSRPVEPAAPVAPGNARTTQAAPQNGQQLDRLNKISSVADYDAALKEFGLPAAV